LPRFLRISAIALIVCCSSVVALRAQQQEKIDYDMVTKIRYEGFHNSHLTELATGLLEAIGPRLTGSTNMKRANEWTRDTLAGFGLQNAHLEAWGPFGRGWSNEYVNVRMVSPDTQTFIAYSKAWTAGTQGEVRGECVRANIATKEDIAKYKGKLEGKIVILGEMPEVKPVAEAPYKRYDEKGLADIGQYQIPSERPRFSPEQAAQRAQFQRDLNQFYSDEKVLAVIDHSRGDIGGGTVFVQSGGSYKRDEPQSTIPQLTLATEQWDRIARLLADHKKVELAVDVRNSWYDADEQYDTVAEIPGTDKKDEVVMLGAHLDSWHTGTGATDNGAGTLVMMEAVRILQSLGVKPRRTIRIGLWSGEEQGLLGSQWYVTHQFGSRPPMDTPQMKGMPTLQRREAGPVTVKPEQAKVSVYFNIDNGTGKVRGVYLQENAGAQPIFESWMQPFKDLGMDTLTMRNTGGTDHLSFDAVGIPGFQFIQDPIEYDTRTHHSNMDVYDRLQFDDLRQIAVIVADFVYNAAQRDQMFPRKPIEKELPPRQRQSDDENGAPRPQRPRGN
jgi:carboxypeptidase Q